MWLLFVLNLFAECVTNIDNIELVDADKFGLKYEITGEFKLEDIEVNHMLAFTAPAMFVRHIYLYVGKDIYHCYTFDITSDGNKFYEAVIQRCVCRTKRIKKYFSEAFENYSDNHDEIFNSPAFRH